MTSKEQREQALKLSHDERYDLAMDLWDSVEEPLPDVDDATWAELQRRMDDIERNPSQLRPWEEVDREIEASLRARRSAR